MPLWSVAVRKPTGNGGRGWRSTMHNKCATALTAAILEGNVDIAHLLLKKRACPKRHPSASIDSVLPLAAAIITRNIQMAQTLLLAGAASQFWNLILNKVIKLYPTFDNGVSHAHYHRVLHRVLMAKIPRMNGSPAYHGLPPSPIYTALVHGPPEVLKALAEAGADVNSPLYPPRGTSPGISALRLCLTQRCGLQKLKILVELGAKDATDECDSPTTSISLIELAVRNLDFDRTMLLLENNLDPDPWPKSDRTALQLALFPESPKKECDDSMELAKLLCSKGVDPNLVAQKDRLTPLQQAIEHGNLEIVELLFEHHANVNKHSEPDVEFDLSATH
ncbi:uncharacterized protein QC764_702960 [Podospora pseudoanserina]|uniref:Ankyrin n=1 Tax=Podospora pseudoanserina TaxID=2609844 RepID=A0ABR0HIW7_9PEZI|nr:hypothetical protein QC764_702960 [Podospora pseudoanserina]